VSRTSRPNDEEGAGATSWRWLDGPAGIDRPGADARRFAAALATQLRAPLSYGSWSCVLQWHDEPTADAEASATRCYELSFWIHGEPPRPGEELGPPGVFVARATLDSNAASAMRDAVSRLLDDAARALDARAAAHPAQASATTTVPARGRASSRVARSGVVSPRSRPPRPARGRRTLRRVAFELAVAAVAVVAGLYAVQAYVVRPYVVPSSSMASTLVRGQRVLVDRLIYRLRPVARGDVVAFRRPPSPHDVQVGQVVGVPGDVLSLRAGHLYVNGLPASAALADDDVLSPLPTAPFAPGAGAAPWSLARPYRVPAGRYFVLGVGHSGANDSRAWGTLPRSAIIGQAFLSFSLPDHIHRY